MDQHELAMLNLHIQKMQADIPSAFLVPNVAQARFIDYLEAKPFPKDMVFMAGNGVGKTVVGALIFGGLFFGPRVMAGSGIHPGYDGNKHFEAWTSFRATARAEGRLMFGRIVATAASLKGNGAVMQRIRRYWPKGCWKGEKLGMSYISEFWIWDRPEDYGNKELAVGVIDVKTVEQDALAHAGPDMDVIWFDEPSTKDVYAENVGRCRSNADAIRIHTLTPLELAGWLIDDVVNAADGVNTVVVYGSLWENCRDWSPEAKYWSGGEVGTGRVLTRGSLEKRAIDDLVDSWKRQSPATLEARLHGKPTHLMGSVYKFYSPAVHCHDGVQLPADWEEYPIWNVIDPHHVRAPAVTWWWRGPVQDILIGEWPTEDYTKMSASLKTIDDYVEKIQELEHEAGISDRVKYRFADPNSMLFTYSMRTQDSNIGQTLQALYSNAGLDYELAPDNLRTGHEDVSTAMSYDVDQPIGPGNLPKLLFLSRNLVCGGMAMVNVPNSMSRYAIKAKPLESNKTPTNLKTIVSETYKDFADNVRYFITASKDYPRDKIKNMMSTYDAILAARANIVQLANSRKWR